MKSLFEELGGTYTLGKDGMYYPNLIFEEADQRPIGKWGRMHREYLKENGSVAVHHTLGRYIRNEWGLWTGSELKSELEKKGFTHPDDMSDYIIREYIDVLKAREADEAGRG